MATMTATRISMEIGCSDECNAFAAPLYLQLSGGNYDDCSVLEVPERLEGWRSDHRTARKRADRVERRGYTFQPVQREKFTADIYAINTSLDVRQGRPMSAAYGQHPVFAPLDYPCSRHGVHTYGVLLDDTLVAYAWVYRSGELALVSSILGHGDHLENEVMYLLMQGVIDRELEHGGFLVYNRHDSGTDGLRFFKERCGFREQAVEWAP